MGASKKRTSDIERARREFRIASHGLRVGDPLTGLEGSPSGSPGRIADEPTSDGAQTGRDHSSASPPRETDR